MRKLWPAAPALPLSSGGSDRRTRDRPRRSATALDTRKDKAILPALHHARDILTTSTTATTIDDSNGRRRRRSATIDDDDDCGYTYYHDGGGYDDCVDVTHQAPVITTYR